MGTENSRIRMTLRDEVSRTAGKIKKNMNMTGVLRANVISFNAGIEVAQKFFGVLKAGVGVIGEFIAVANEQERVEAQLAATLRSTGNAAGFVAEEITRQAAAMQELTTFGDEAIIGAQSLLLTFTKLKDDVFPAATLITLDIAAAMGQDLKSSAILVGKALNDPILGLSALTRVGITFSDQQKDQIKLFVETGDVMSAQNVILKELNTQFGGSAAAAAKTFGGEMKQIANELGDAKEKMGKLITESADLRAVIKTIVDISRDLFSELFDGTQTLDDLGTTGKNTFQFIFDGIKFVRIGAVGFNTVLSTAINTLSLIQEVGTTAWDLIRASIISVNIVTKEATESALRFAADAAFAAGAQDLGDKLLLQAVALDGRITKLKKDRTKVNTELGESQERINTVISEYQNILDKAGIELARIDESQLSFTRKLEANTIVAREAKAEIEKLREAERKLADDRAARKLIPEFLRSPQEGGDTAFSLQRPVQTPEESDIEKRRNFTASLMDLEQASISERFNLFREDNSKRIEAAGTVMNAILSIQGSGSKKMFKIQKAANIAQALMSTFTGAAKALELGPIAGPIAAGAILAAGFARVKQITATKFGGGGGGSGGGGRIGFAPARPTNDLFQRGAGFQAAPIRRRGEGIVVNINTGGAPILRENQLTDFIVMGLKNRIGRDGLTLEPVIGAT